MAKHPYRGGRPKGVKNGESTTHKGKKWTTQEEKDELWKKAKQKIAEEYGSDNDRTSSNWVKYGNKYDTWVVNLQPEVVDMLTDDELMDVIYKYKGNYELWKQGTKEPDFDGKYGKK